MELPVLTVGTFSQDVGFAALATILISMFKSLLELWAPLAPTAKAHDPVIQAVALLTNLLVAFGIAGATTGVSGKTAVGVALVGLMQWGVSAGIYHSTTRLGASVNQSTGALAATAQAKTQNIYSASDFANVFGVPLTQTILPATPIPSSLGPHPVLGPILSPVLAGSPPAPASVSGDDPAPDAASVPADASAEPAVSPAA